MINASVYIIVLNGELILEKTLNSIKEFAEIILVDSGSTDNTIKIAQKYGAKIYYHKFINYTAQKEFALSLCSKDWVLNVDSDEVISVQLKQEIIDIIKQTKPKIVGLKIPFIEFALYELDHCYVYKNAKVRFFNKQYGYYKQVTTHEGVVVKGNIQKAKGVIYHYGWKDLKTYIEKTLGYAYDKAQEEIARGRKHNIIKLLFSFPFAFLRSYLLKRNVFNGKKGFVIAIVVSFYAFCKEAYLYEYYKKSKIDRGIKK